MSVYAVPGHSGIPGNETTNVLAMIFLLSEDDLVVGPDSPICHLYGLINGWIRGEEQRRWGNGSCFCVSRCLWNAVNSTRTDWILGLDKASLRLVIGFVTTLRD